MYLEEATLFRYVDPNVDYPEPPTLPVIEVDMSDFEDSADDVPYHEDWGAHACF